MSRHHTRVRRGVKFKFWHARCDDCDFTVGPFITWSSAFRRAFTHAREQA